MYTQTKGPAQITTKAGAMSVEVATDVCVCEIFRHVGFEHRCFVTPLWVRFTIGDRQLRTGQWVTSVQMRSFVYTVDGGVYE